MTGFACDRAAMPRCLLCNVLCAWCASCASCARLLRILIEVFPVLLAIATLTLSTHIQHTHTYAYRVRVRVIDTNPNPNSLHTHVMVRFQRLPERMVGVVRTQLLVFDEGEATEIEAVVASSRMHDVPSEQ